MNSMTTLNISTSLMNDETIQTINGRDLHKALEIKRDFSHWIKDQIERLRLVENRDFTTTYLNILKDAQSGRGGHNKIDYHFSIDVAKHISMMCGTDKGFEVREYFINIEKEYKQENQNLNQLTEIELAERYLNALKEKEAYKQKIAESLMFKRIEPENKGKTHISIRNIKNTYAPYLSEGVIKLFLNYYGHSKTLFNPPIIQNQDTNIPVFEEEGLEEVISKFLSDCEIILSKSKKSLILKHECLMNGTAQILKEYAVEYLNYNEEDFE
jgi:phage anti-repressor protein